uniref:CSON007937 protein n=1 Tax=Culicoides sonorensis TaxID=179676 RepID=A0A336LGM0_CULSO
MSSILMKDHVTIQNMKMKIKKLCRICLFNENNKNYNNNDDFDEEKSNDACNYQNIELQKHPKMYSIHKTMIGKSYVRELISNVTKIEITKGDGYPELICETCLEKFRVANYIQMQCLATHALLQETFKPKNSGIQSKPPKKSLKCAHCNSYFRDRMNLLNHIRSHVERKFTCQFCGLQFIRSDHLKCHTDVKHSKMYMKNFKCDLCSFESYLKQNLRVHMRVHTTEKKQFKCKYCEKSYSYHCDLKRHVFQHENNSPYRCETCDKSFYSKSNLKVHQKIHLGIKKYKCSYCKQEFSQNICLINHVRALHSTNSMKN